MQEQLDLFSKLKEYSDYMYADNSKAMKVFMLRFSDKQVAKLSLIRVLFTHNAFVIEYFDENSKYASSSFLLKDFISWYESEQFLKSLSDASK